VDTTLVFLLPLQKEPASFPRPLAFTRSYSGFLLLARCFFLSHFFPKMTFVKSVYQAPSRGAPFTGLAFSRMSFPADFFSFQSPHLASPGTESPLEVDLGGAIWFPSLLRFIKIVPAGASDSFFLTDYSINQLN